MIDEISQVSTKDLIPYAKNARTHTDEQVAQIAASIREFGFVNPVLLKDDNTIIAGHGRVMAARKLGLDTVPAVYLSHLTDTQARAYVIADNKLALNAGWDDELLNLELGDLADEGFDLDLTGFDVGEIEELAGRDGVEVVEDEVPEPPVDPITKPGDLWILGEHRLLCGDSTKAEDVARLMAGAKADMVHTDPPYGMSFQSNMRTKSKKFNELENDDKILTGWITPAIAASNGWVFVWTTWKVLEQWLPVVREFGKMTNLVVWAKGGGGIGDLKRTFATDHEMAMVFNRGAEICGKRIGSVWSFGKDAPASYMHPTQKPVALAGEAIDKTTNPANLVYDPFLGSGTTLIAAEQLGRKCYGMEISPQYCDVIVKRWENLTGKKAVHA